MSFGVLVPVNIPDKAAIIIDDLGLPPRRRDD